jgi:hypothetical protein
METPEERRFQRFDLSYPVHVKFPSGNATAEVDAVTRNISIGGLLLESTRRIPYRSPVEFEITLAGPPISRLFQLGGAGEVVRVEPGATTDRFAIAVVCAQPIYQIEAYLSAATGQ